MLSIYTLKSASKAADYFGQENYYLSDTAHHQKKNDGTEGMALFQGQWFGKGAEKLGLKGKATPQQFEEVLLGKLSPEIWMKNTLEGKHHRPGYDLTFSAPKSVSILAVILKDERLLAAHRTAVQKVLSLIEKEYAITRVKEAESGFEKTENLIFSIFEHIDSRALDPELHSHTILANATQRENGEWRTLDSYPIYRDKILLGMYYRAYLAPELMRLGFDIVQTSNQGTFELKDFPPALIKQLSKRRTQIKAELKETGQSGGKAAKVANFNTRPPKKQVDPEHLQLAWTVELSRCGYSLEWLQQYVDAAKARGPIVPPDPQKMADNALNNAILHLSEWQGAFSAKDLRKTALGLSINSHAGDHIESAIVKHLETGDLRYLGENKFTTQTARDLEIQNAAAMRLGKKQVAPIFGKLSANYLASQFFKTSDEKKVFGALLTCRDKELVFDYHRKADFKAIISPYIQLIRQYYLYPTVLTQSAVRAKALSQALGTDYSRTIAGFLQSLERKRKKEPDVSLEQREQSRAVWIVDGESEIGLSQVRALQDYAAHFGARIIWGQDFFKKRAAIESLIQHGITRLSLAKQNPDKRFENLNQKDLKLVLDSLKQNNRLIEIPDSKQREALIVQSYLALGESASIWGCSKMERDALNDKIREAKQEAGTLQGLVRNVNTLQPIKLTRIQKSLAKFYQLTDVVHFTKENEALGISANSYLSVKDIQLSARTLSLMDDTGKEIHFSLKRKNVGNLQLYRLENKSIQVNEWIVWNKTHRNFENRALERLSGEKAKVVGLEGSQITVELQNKNLIILDANNKKDSHWDYGYALNQKPELILDSPLIVVLNSYREGLYQTFGQTILSANKNLSIFCDDFSKVEERLLTAHQPLLALSKPVVRYTPDAQNNKLEQQIKECFPKYSARLEGYFNEHRELLETVMQTYEKEKPIFTIEGSKAIEDFEKIAKADATVSSALSDTAKELHTESESQALKQSQVIKASQTIDWLCAKYAERNAVFEFNKLEQELFKLVGLSIPPQILKEQLSFAFKQGILLPIYEEVVIRKGITEKRIFVATREMVALEKACIHLVEKDKNVLPSIINTADISKTLEAHQKLTDGQKAALKLILTNEDRVIGIQGVAGAGKTTLLRTLNREARAAGYELLGLSNSTAARQRLQEGSQDVGAEDAFLKSGIESLTTRKFLIKVAQLLKKDEQLARLEYGGNRMLILDEASFTSTRELFALINIIQKLDIRLVMLGDYAQLNSVEAGRIFYLLLGSLMLSYALTENVRFGSLKALETMKFIYKTHIGAALKNLGVSLIEIPDREERLDYIAKRYLDKSLEEKANSLIVTPLNKDRQAVNQRIHEGLKEEGLLKGFDVEATILVAAKLTEVEKQRIYSFEENQWIRFNQKGLNIDIKAGEYCKVLDKNYTDQTLLLERLNGERLYWSPERNIRQDMGALEVYEVEDLKLMVDEKIRWLRNDEKRGIRNGETALVLSVNENQMTVKLMDGSEQTLDLNLKENQHWDYAYAATAHVVQGDNKFDTTAHATGGSENAVNPPKISSIESLLVSVTRGDEVTVVTDNIKTYEKALYASLDVKRSTQEYLDPNREVIKTKVRRMTENITGRAEKNASKEKSSERASSVQEEPKRYPAKRSAPKSEKKAYIDQDLVNSYLERDILGYAEQWLGQPKSRSGSEARFKGAITVNFRGTKAGWWKCWSDTKQGGKDLISLYAFVFELPSWYDALVALAQNFGIKAEELLFENEKSKVQEAKRALEKIAKAEAAAKALAKDEAERIKKALDCYNRSIPITNTLAQKYLRETRGIQSELPEDFRFCERIKHKDTQKWTPALVVPVRNAKGEIQGITRIFLDKDGKKLKTSYIDKFGNKKAAADKLSLGLLTQTEAIVNQGQNAETVYIVEGIETALSVRDARPEHKIVVTLSASRLYDVPLSAETKRVVICADEDGPNASSNKSVVDAVNTYLAKGLQVEVAYPRALANLDKTDFNDLSRTIGVQAVKEDFDKTIRIQTNKSLSVSALLDLKNEVQKTKNTLSEPHYQPQEKEQQR